MTLTNEQRTALENGESIPLVVDGTPCVLLRRDVYEEVRRTIEPSPRETYPAVLKALDRDDVAPDQYLEYLNE